MLQMRTVSLAILLAVAAAQDVPDAIGKYPLPTWTSIVLFSVLIGFGLVQTFFGHRLLRLTLFTVALLAAGGAILIPTLLYMDSPAAPWVGLGIGGVVGLSAGFVAARFPKLGVFLVGAAGGGALGFFLSASVGVHIPINANASTAVLVVAGAAVFGALSLILMRIIIILSTSLLGAFCVMFGIGRLVPSNKFPNIFDLANELSVNAGSLPKYVWGYLAGIAVLAALGIIVQFCFTAGKRKAPADKAGKEAKEADEWERLVHGEDGESDAALRLAEAACAAATSKSLRQHLRPQQWLFCCFFFLELRRLCRLNQHSLCRQGEGWCRWREGQGWQQGFQQAARCSAR